MKREAVRKKVARKDFDPGNGHLTSLFCYVMAQF